MILWAWLAACGPQVASTAAYPVDLDASCVETETAAYEAVAPWFADDGSDVYDLGLCDAGRWTAVAPDGRCVAFDLRCHPRNFQICSVLAGCCDAVGLPTCE